MVRATSGMPLNRPLTKKSLAFLATTKTGENVFVSASTSVSPTTTQKVLHSLPGRMRSAATRGAWLTSWKGLPQILNLHEC